MRLEPVPEQPVYIDPQTGQTYPLNKPRWRADAGGALMITPLPGIARSDIDTALAGGYGHKQ
jgi:threonine synthase